MDNHMEKHSVIKRYIMLLSIFFFIIWLQACNNNHVSIPIYSMKNVGVSFEDSFIYCDSQDKHNVQKQVGPYNILPGKSTKNDVLNKLKHANKIDDDHIYYEKEELTFELADSIVFEIYDFKYITLEEILRKYGCPDLLFTTEDTDYSDEWAYLIYLKGGLIIKFIGNKLEIFYQTDYIQYIQSSDSIDEFYSNYPGSKIYVPQKWNDVVIP